MELETDANGIVTFLPVINWAVTIVPGRRPWVWRSTTTPTPRTPAAARLSRIQLHLDQPRRSNWGPRSISGAIRCWGLSR